MNTKRILGITAAVLLCTAVYGASNVSAGGSIDVNMGSNMEPTGSGSFNLEYKPLSIFSIGVKASGQTDFEDFFAVTPSVFARYPGRIA